MPDFRVFGNRDVMICVHHSQVILGMVSEDPRSNRATPLPIRLESLSRYSSLALGLVYTEAP